MALSANKRRSFQNCLVRQQALSLMPLVKGPLGSAGGALSSSSLAGFELCREVTHRPCCPLEERLAHSGGALLAGACVGVVSGPRELEQDWAA